MLATYTRLLAGILGSLILLAGAPQEAHGAPFLLTSTVEGQLEAWLGEGALEFTNLYEKAPDSNSLAFHAAADGRGATFTLMEAIYGDQTYVIGGYNPQSWSSTDTFSLTPTDAERTAFIYNLTSGTRQDQRLTTDPFGSSYGLQQAVNYSLWGPSFGYYGDLYVLNDLVSGVARQGSFGEGPCSEGNTSILGTPYFVEPCNTLATEGNGIFFTVGALEVYSFRAADVSPAPVPEPATLTLFGAGLAALAFRKRRAGIRSSAAR